MNQTRINVAVVDDDVSFARALDRLFRALGFGVRTYPMVPTHPDRVGGLDFLSQSAYALAVLTVMPLEELLKKLASILSWEKDYELPRELNADCPFAHLVRSFRF